MSAKDAIHKQVKAALVKDGWTVTADPFMIRYAEVTVLADLSAERVVAAERGRDRIVVEIKSFSGVSAIQDFKLALGQYLMYRTFLEELAPERKTYLAVPLEAYSTFFAQVAIRFLVDRLRVLLIAVDVDAEEIVTWTS